MRYAGFTVAAVAMVLGVTAAGQPVSPPFRVDGQLTKIEGKSLTITAAVEGQAKDMVMTCNDATEFGRDKDFAMLSGTAGVKVTFEDLRVGQQVLVIFNTMADKERGIASSVIINPFRVFGKLTMIDGKSLTITDKLRSRFRNTVVNCNDATQVRLEHDPRSEHGEVTFKDLKVGQWVTVFYNIASEKPPLRIAATVSIQEHGFGVTGPPF